MLAKKWYFCVNERGFRQSKPLMRVAIASCLSKTTLEPICIYNGSNKFHVRTLSKMGAKVVRHRSSFEDVLRKGYGDDFDKYSGHWLRVDLPNIEVDDDIVLYTDVDVMFVDQPIIRKTPRYLAAAPETYRWRYPHFNSGVMILNLAALREVHHTFIATIENRMAKGWRPPGHDQVSYNKFFRWRYTPMRSRMNWKPYWGGKSRCPDRAFPRSKARQYSRSRSGHARKHVANLQAALAKKIVLHTRTIALNSKVIFAKRFCI